MTTTLNSTQVLDSIQTQRRDAPLTILHHADALLPQSQTQTNTDANVTPASLAADLAHYRDLFSKLRFSYLEQVTKEKYLRGIVGEPPLIATAEDNAALEERVGGMKTELQGKKRGVEALVTEMEELSREVAGLHETVDQGVNELEVVPGEVDALEKEVEELRALVKEREGEEIEDPRMGLSLQETEELLVEARKRDAELKRVIERVQGDLPGRIRECEDVEKELEELERRRNEVTRAAKEARRLKEEGGRDLLEEQGRWYQSSEAVMNRLLGLET